MSNFLSEAQCGVHLKNRAQHVLLSKGDLSMMLELNNLNVKQGV